ncbi:cyclase family protein [Rhodococcus opacus]|nr:cyclase family protein [Rhodococcus opacus]
MTAPLPLYDELPAGSLGGRLGWGVFGDTDQRGTINHLTPEIVESASKLVKRGVTFPLDHPIGHFSPPIVKGRLETQHHVIEMADGLAMDDYYDAYFPQGGSQWDSLAHFGYERDKFYNGASVDEIRSQNRNTIHSWTATGIVGRGVVLDMPAYFESTGVAYRPDETFEITSAHLDGAATLQGSTRKPGDILLVYTGFDRWYESQDHAGRTEITQRKTIAGLARSEETARHLWNTRVAAVASDNLAVEASPGDFSADAMPFGFLHQMLIGSLGIALGELWKLADLVADCRESHVYEGMLVSTPIGAPGGIGSPANAILIK